MLTGQTSLRPRVEQRLQAAPYVAASINAVLGLDLFVRPRVEQRLQAAPFLAASINAVLPSAVLGRRTLSSDYSGARCAQFLPLERCRSVPSFHCETLNLRVGVERSALFT